LLLLGRGLAQEYGIAINLGGMGDWDLDRHFVIAALAMADWTNWIASLKLSNSLSQYTSPAHG